MFLIAEKHGFRFESLPPDTTMGIQHCWVKRSLTREVIIHATSETLVGAIDKALEMLREMID